MVEVAAEADTAAGGKVATATDCGDRDNLGGLEQHLAELHRYELLIVPPNRLDGGSLGEVVIDAAPTAASDRVLRAMRPEPIECRMRSSELFLKTARRPRED